MSVVDRIAGLLAVGRIAASFCILGVIQSLAQCDAAPAAEIAIDGHADNVMGIAFSPNGKVLASGGADGTVKLWDFATGRVYKTLKGHTNTVCSVDISPDGKTVASGSRDQTVKFWDIESGQMTRTLVHEDQVTVVRFSSRGKAIACSVEPFREEKRFLYLWDVGTGVKTASFTRHSTHWIAFAPDGKTLLVSESVGQLPRDETSVVTFWNIETGEIERELKVPNPAALAISRDGNRLAVASFNCVIRQFDLKTGKNGPTLKADLSQFRDVQYSPDGNLLATVESQIKLWHSHTGEAVASLRLAGDSPICIAFSPDGSTLAIGYLRGLVRFLDVKTHKLKYRVVNQNDKLKFVQ